MLTKTTGKPLDPAEQAKRYEDANKARELSNNDNIPVDSLPIFDSLGDLSSIFKATVQVDIPLPNDNIMTFHVKKIDPGTLFMTNRTLIFLLKNEMDNNDTDIETMSTMDVLASMDAHKIKEYEDAMADDMRTKQDIILSNVIEPVIDREFLDLLSSESIDLLFSAIASSLQEAQPLLHYFLISQKLKDSETLIHKIYLLSEKTGKRPSELLFPDMNCATSTLAIDLFVFDIGYFISEEKRLRELELNLTAMMGGSMKKGLVGI